MSDFSPAPLMILETPEQIKAFTDPLRLRVLRILRERPATNQQVADELGEPHAKVLYHIRFLLEAGLIKLVDTQIKGVTSRSTTAPSLASSTCARHSTIPRRISP